MKYFVYVLKSGVAKKSYVGYTNNVNRRLSQHNAGSCAYTKKYKPWHIVHTDEFDRELNAIQREKYLKSASGRRLVLKKLLDS